MEKQNSKDVSFKKYNKGGLVSTIFGLIEAVLWIAVGVVAIIFSDNKDFHNAIFLVIGIMLTISGLMKIITNFMPIVANSFVEAAVKAKAKAEMSYNLVVGGSFELALGVTFIIIYATNAALFQSIISIIASYVGIIMIVAGLSLILFAIGFIISKLYTVGVTILQIVFGGALLGLGIWALIYILTQDSASQDFFKLCLIIAGVLVIITGVSVGVMTVIAAKAANDKAKGKEKEKGTVKAETVEPEPAVKEEAAPEEEKEAAPEITTNEPKEIEEKK